MNRPQNDIPWKESNFHSDCSSKHGHEEDDLFDLFADPEPYECFEFKFPPSIKIRLNGHKQENGQLLKSTGLTLWRASEALCDYLLDHHEIVQRRVVLELGAGLGLCGILAHKLGASHVYITDGDLDTMSNLRENVRMNRCDPSKVSCPQLIWGGKYPNEKADAIIAADVTYTTQMLEPLWETVSSVLTPKGIFVLSCTRRHVPIELVFDFATNCGFTWDGAVDGEGIIVFSRKSPN